VGSTGVGKTTLVDIVLGLLLPSEGEILVNGFALDAASAGAWRARCGYVPQDVFLADDTVTANVAFGVPEAEIDYEAVESAVRAAQLHEFVEGLPAGYETIVGERGIRMSGGQRQRIGIARALYRDPEVLVLDEATSALDGLTESAVIDTIQSFARRKTIMVVAHRLTTVRACDVIYVLEDGRVAGGGTYDELIRDHLGFRAMAGQPEG
jgi:ABC-type multidrug transport system fused ATPase/permease subunit